MLKDKTHEKKKWNKVYSNWNGDNLIKYLTDINVETFIHIIISSNLFLKWALSALRALAKQMIVTLFFTIAF